MLLTTFWPQDYWRGTICQIGEQDYQITRYVRGLDPRYFEVWGRVVARRATMLDTQEAPTTDAANERAA